MTILVSKDWTGLYSFPKKGVVNIHFQRMYLLINACFRRLHIVKISSKSKARLSKYKAYLEFNNMGETAQKYDESERYIDNIIKGVLHR